MNDIQSLVMQFMRKQISQNELLKRLGTSSSDLPAYVNRGFEVAIKNRGDFEVECLVHLCFLFELSGDSLIDILGELGLSLTALSLLP